MVSIVLLGMILAGAGWFVFLSIPNWQTAGTPEFIIEIMETFQGGGSFFDFQYYSALRDVALAIAILGTGIVIVTPIIKYLSNTEKHAT